MMRRGEVRTSSNPGPFTRRGNVRKDQVMDRGQFDALARLVSNRQSRRTALATLLGAIVFRIEPASTAARRKRRGGRRISAQAADTCFPGARCTPGKGRNTSGCDFAFSTAFRNKDVRGANLSHSNFYNADLTGADFRGANLSGGCFINANLTGARLGKSVNLHNAVFCRTTMPNGTLDTSGCEGTTPCCHRREQNCRDQNVYCFTADDTGSVCLEFQGTLGSLGMCWSFDFGCCPCGPDPTQDHWGEQCNKTFSGCGGNCVAGNEIPFECLSFRNCAVNG
jgi:hypothetical protein